MFASFVLFLLGHFLSNRNIKYQADSFLIKSKPIVGGVFKSHSFPIISANTQRYSQSMNLFSISDSCNDISSIPVNQTEVVKENEGSGVATYYQEVISILAKIPINRLRQLIQTHKASVMPSVNADTEAHVSAALDAAWSSSGGDWDGLLSMVKKEFFDEISDTNFNLEIAVAAANKLSDKKIKDLLRKYGDPNSGPKLDKKKFVGKFLKSDYVVELIDVLREANRNDYGAVARILEKEYQANKETGFGK